jgi:predicted Ser/Thr protein kinase
MLFTVVLEGYAVIRVDKCIGEGNHSYIYLGTNTQTEEKVALKMSNRGKSTDHLKNEAKVYRVLNINKTGGYYRISLIIV